MIKVPFLCLFFLLPVSIISHSLHSQRSTLLSVKTQWGNDLPALSTWNSATSPCTWAGIQCSSSATSNSGREVTGISLYNASISSPIPPSICDLKTLKYLNLSWNNIPGGFPTGLYGCAGLTHLDLSGNLFVGPIPDDVHKLSPSSLQYLDISANNFTGNIPSSIGGLKQLKILHLNNNLFNGTYPAEISNLSNLEVLIMAANPFAPMALPPEWGKLNNLKFLFMKDCNLAGEIPGSFNGLESLQHLDLAENQLVGRIPDGLFLLKGLQFVDLHYNRLVGRIPDGLFLLKGLQFVDLHYNRLSGEIPSSIDKELFAKSFLNNTKLCTKNTTHILGLRRCSTSSKYMLLVIILPVIVFSVVLYFTVFAIKQTKRRKKITEEQTLLKFTPFHRLEFTEDDIISSLFEHNIIGSRGSGKVYLVQIGNSGYSVAVKRIWNNRNHNNSQFLAEVEILGNIRHANIVKLLCCISSEQSKLLVYEYMENHSLDRWIHRRRRLESESRGNPLHVLNWPTRLRIAIGAAKGLSYVHHDCGTPTIHRDIKSSNILLDSEFNAMIADFGLARVTEKEGELHSMSNVAGSFGYLAPEYRYTKKVNEKIDVYSFGVVLLELATGKEPCCREESLNLADWSWRHYCEGKPIHEALDEEVMQIEYLEGMSKVFKLGLMCTTPSPNSRPSMKDILQVLNHSNPLEL